MIIVGLTGCIASGKSTVAAMLRNANIAIVDADELSRLAMKKGTVVAESIIHAFGESVVLSDGSINREQLGKIVFSDACARRKLEAIVHPEIKRLQESEFENLRNCGTPIAVYVAPLLFEARAKSTVDQIILVVAREELILRRLVERDGLSVEDAKKRIRAQMRNDEKIKLADHIIENNGDLNELCHNLKMVWENISGSKPNIVTSC